MHLQKYVAFLLSLTVSLIFTFCRHAGTSSLSQSATPTTAPTMVMYALSTPADVPGLSRKPDRETEHLFGPVKTVKWEQLNTSKVFGLFTRTQSRLISSISFNTEGNKTEEINYNNGGDSIHSCSYSYDGKGRKTAQVMAQGNIHGETTYAYNHDGREVEALEQVGEKVLIKRRYLATYDAQGKQIAALYSEGDREMKASYRYSYDKQGQLTELASFTAEGVVYHRIAYSYDEKGNLTSELAYRPDGQLYKKSLFSYEGGKKREEMFTFNEDGSRNIALVQIYDSRDDVVEAGGLDQGDNCCRTVRIYEYDQMGNWTKQTVRSVEPATGKVIDEWFEERRIEYY